MKASLLKFFFRFWCDDKVIRGLFSIPNFKVSGIGFKVDLRYPIPKKDPIPNPWSQCYCLPPFRERGWFLGC